MQLTRLLRWMTIALLLTATALPALAAGNSFVVQDIEVHGLKRISTGTVFTYLPIAVGDKVDAADIRSAIKALYQTGFFSDIEMRRAGDTLIVDVKERPTIANFSIVGNKAIKTEDLKKSLKKVGLAKGRIFSRSVRNEVKQELIDQYHGHGKYNARIDVNVLPVGNNRVNVTVKISEGVDTTIKSINIVGNETFSDSTLLDQFKLQPTQWFSLFQTSNKYVREKLSGDLESLRSYYMDRGYADFRINSVQVTLSPDYKHIFITINIHEGTVYKVTSAKLKGRFVVPKKQLKRLIVTQPGTTFSLGRAQFSSKLMTDLLGDHGYAFAKINPIPKLDHKNHTVAITFHVSPGKRVYVRHINFTGAPATDNTVFRRNMRQTEGAWLSNTKLKLSKFYIKRLRFIKSVKESTDPVPGSPDLVDLNYKLTPRQAGKFIFAIGYSPFFGVSLNAGIKHYNFLGEGDTIDLQLFSSQINEAYDITFRDPYATVNGVSRSTRIYYRHSHQLILDAAPLDTRSYGLSLVYGIPITGFSHYALGVGASSTDLVTNRRLSSNQYVAFASDPNNGHTYKTPVGPGITYRELNFITGWTRDTRNFRLFASHGNRQNISLRIATPDSDVKYYRLSFQSTDLVPVGGGFLYRLSAGLGLNETYGDSHSVPPRQHFFVGGPDSVRGYHSGYLGPFDNRGYPAGGNFKFYAQNELIIPSVGGVGGSQSPNSRFGLFVDAGNAFAEPRDFSVHDLYESYGLFGQFVTPLGVMRVSLGWPFGNVPGYLTEIFQFTVAKGF